MKKKIYLFNGTSRAAAYGIGTYIDQLVHCLRDSEIEFEVVHLYADGKTIERVEKDGYWQINIPGVNYPDPEKASAYYGKTIAYLLRDFIPTAQDVRYIFHLNFMTNEALVRHLKRLFPCRVILVAHYTNWSFTLMGDEGQFRKLMRKRYARIKSETEQKLFRDTKEDFRMIGRCDRFVCVARHTLESLNKVKPLDKVASLVIPNAIRDTFTHPTEEQKRVLRASWHLAADTPVVLFAGRLDEVKGVDYLIEAFKLTRITHPDAHLFIAGEGNFAKLLSQGEKHWTTIHFTGRLNKNQLYELYSIANAGVVCSLHEEFGLVALEMMMYALPVVVTDTGGLSEIVEDGVSGIKIPLTTTGKKRSIDAKLLSEKINYLLEHPDEARQLGKCGRERFLTTYELAAFKEQMLNLYREL